MSKDTLERRERKSETKYVSARPEGLRERLWWREEAKFFFLGAPCQRRSGKLRCLLSPSADWLVSGARISSEALKENPIKYIFRHFLS